MSKQKCDYCGKEIEAEYMSALENGSPACPECVEAEYKHKLSNSSTNNKATSEENTKIDHWRKSSKTDVLIFCSMAVLLGLIISFTGIFVFGCNDRNDQDSSSQTSFEDSLESIAETRARGFYMLRYDVSSVNITVASVKKIGDKWRVAGKVHAIDAYGDSFSANWSIIYDEKMQEVDSEFNTPLKD